MKKPAVLFLIASVAVSAAVFSGWRWQTVWRWQESTDDAYLSGNVTPLTAKIGGHVVALEVKDNQLVHQGDVLLRIDPRDYLVRRDQAAAIVAARLGALQNLEARLEQQQAAIAAAEAQTGSARAELVRASADLNRSSELVRQEFTSRQKLDSAVADNRKAEAAVRASSASADASRRQLAVLDSERAISLAQLDQARAELAAAELDVQHTVITAPLDGLIGNRAVQLGSLLRPGTALLTVVPTSQLWINANYKETQIGAMQPGQPVDVRVDSFPGEHFRGTVDSLAPASGAVFSLLPPDNATGNFTKIVQRLPVKITIDPSHPLAARLRPGMSAVVTVTTRSDRP